MDERTIHNNNQNDEVEIDLSRLIAALVTLVVVLGGAYTAVFHVLPEMKYREAAASFAQGDFAAAEETFLKLKTYRDSEDQVLACRFSAAQALMEKADEAHVFMLLSQRTSTLLRPCHLKYALHHFN